MLKKFKQGKGFTLVELLAAIVIIGVVTSIAIPLTTNYITSYKEAAFFTNVQIIVDDFKRQDILNEEKRVRAYKVNAENFDNVDEINVIGYTDDTTGKRKYIVVANSDSELGKAIVTEDFYSLSKNEKDEWAAISEEDEEKAEELFRNIIEKASKSVGENNEQ